MSDTITSRFLLYIHSSVGVIELSFGLPRLAICDKLEFLHTSWTCAREPGYHFLVFCVKKCRVSR